MKKTTIFGGIVIGALLALNVVAEKTVEDERDKAHFKVKGLTCGGCEKHLDGELAKLDGVEVKKVCHRSGKAILFYDSDKITKKKLAKAVKDAGYKVTGEQITVPVSGMTCTECSGKVAKSLEALEGVSKQEVSHTDNEAVIVFDPDKMDRDQIIAAINKTGFRATP